MKKTTNFVQITAKRKGERFAYFATTTDLNWLNRHVALDRALSTLSALVSPQASLKAAVGDRIIVTDGAVKYTFRVGATAAGLGLVSWS